MKLDREIEFFDKFARQHGDYDVLGGLAYRQLLKRFKKLVEPRAGEICADLGCGTGAFTRRLAALGMDLLGIDVSPESIARARNLDGGPRYMTGDIRRIDLPAESTDIAVFSGVLHHLPERTDRANALSEAKRILKPGGRLFAFDPHASSPSMFLYRDSRSPLRSHAGKTANEVLLGRRQMREELAVAGFASIDVTGLGGITYSYVHGSTARKFLPMYNIYERLTMIPGFGEMFGSLVTMFGVKPRD